jgi:hypothetical protein
MSSSDREYSLEPRILALDEKVSQIGSKLNVLTYQLDSNSLLWAGLANYNETGRAGSDDYVSSASSEQARAYISVPQIRGDKLIDRRGSDWNGNAEEGTESIRTTMSSMDRHLKILIELFSEQMDKMMSAVENVRTAVLTSIPSTDPSSSLLLTESPVLLTSGRSSSGSSVGKLDQLYQKMAPLLDVSEKMDQVWNVLIGAKSSVDSLVPTSEALLWQTQRQERALTDIHTELNIKTKQILDNLNLLQLGRESHPVPGISSSTSTTSTTSSSTSSRSSSTPNVVGGGATSNLTKRSKSDVHDAGLILANKPLESQQVSVTFKQTEIPTSRGVVGSGSLTSQSLIRAQELSPGPVVSAVLAAAKSSTTTSTTSTTTPLPPPPPEVVPIPSDIMDSEFLHDDPIVVLTSNQTSSGPSSSSSSSKSGENKKTPSLQPSTASVSAANISSTTSRSVLLQHIVPAGPTERSRIPNNSNVIFPSVKNKPGFTNTTFFYDYTTPQNIRVRPKVHL